MPSEPTAEQVEIRRKGRQRLIGAVVLAAAAVVFVPMALDPEPRRERAEPVLAIPPKDGSPPLTAANPPAPATPSSPAQPESAKPAPAAVPETPQAPAPGASPAKAEPRPGARAVPPLEGFAVQVGAFKDEAKLSQARAKVVAARIAHYTERLDGAAGGLTRLRAGPFPTREAADKAAARLKQAGLDVRVVPLP